MYKSKLQELCHQYAWSLPEYVTRKEGPDHHPRFSTSITVNGVLFETPSNQFRSSKEAQNEAAKIAFDYFTVPKPILQQSINPTPVHPKPPINSSSSGMYTMLNIYICMLMFTHVFYLYFSYPLLGSVYYLRMGAVLCEYVED